MFGSASRYSVAFHFTYLHEGTTVTGGRSHKTHDFEMLHLTSDFKASDAIFQNQASGAIFQNIPPDAIFFDHASEAYHEWHSVSVGLGCNKLTYNMQYCIISVMD